MIIYKITNLKNGKIYIGKTIYSLKCRIGGHRRSINKSQQPLYRAMRKYGFESFEFEEIDSCDDLEELNYLEIFWIDYFKSKINQLGYNVGHGGTGGDNFTNNPNKEEIRKKITPNEKTKKRISDTVKKLWENPEYRQHMKDVHKGKKVSKFDLNNNFIESYNSIKEASEKNNLFASNIGKCCLCEKKSAGGFKWKFETKC